MILLILACSGGNAFLPPLSSGRLSVCLDGVGTADLEEGETSLVGTVTAAGKGDCGIAMTVEDGEGNSHTVSLGVTTGQDVATEDSLGDSLGKAVEILFVNIQPWGAASGFKVWDEEGIWLAADEGQWGGALNGKMPEGFSVDAGKEKIASDDIGCGNRVGTTMIFRGEEELELEPGTGGVLQVAGISTNAFAVAADHYEPDGCSMSDSTDTLSWVLSR